MSTTSIVQVASVRKVHPGSEEIARMQAEQTLRSIGGFGTGTPVAEVPPVIVAVLPEKATRGPYGLTIGVATYGCGGGTRPSIDSAHHQVAG